MALTRICTGQQKSGAADILIFRLLICFCMRSPWRSATKIDRERNPETPAGGSQDALSGDCLTGGLRSSPTEPTTLHEHCPRIQG